MVSAELLTVYAAYAYTHLEQNANNALNGDNDSGAELRMFAIGIGLLLVIGTPILGKYLLNIDLAKFRESQSAPPDIETIETSLERKRYRHLKGTQLDANGRPVATSTRTRLLPLNVSPEKIAPPAETEAKYIPTIPDNGNYS